MRHFYDLFSVKIKIPFKVKIHAYRYIIALFDWNFSDFTDIDETEEEGARTGDKSTVNRI